MKINLTKEEADQIAATCYLAIWQIEEFNPVLKPRPGETSLGNLNTQPLKDILAILDYPTEPIYDDDSCPVINWQGGQFHSRFPGDNPREDYEDINSLFDPAEEEE